MVKKVVAIVVAVLVFAVLVVGGLWTNESSAPTSTSNTILENIRTISITGKEFSFSQNEIRVKNGEKVKIILANIGSYPHDWVVDEFSARTAKTNPGQTAEVIFTADKVGIFEYYCSVGNHRAMGMKGKLIVE